VAFALMRFTLFLPAVASGFVRAVAAKGTNASAFVVSNKDIYQLDKGKATASNNTSRAFASSGRDESMPVDPEYPGTAVERLNAVHARVAELARGDDLNGRWEDVRRKLLWAGGLKDLPDAIPGQGYTGHSFNDYNHVDLTTMLDRVSDNENNGAVKGIAIGNNLGNGIRVASIPELGPGGSWSTCAIGCNQDPPRDVAHIQFRSRIAFKLVWVPNERFDTFVLVADDGSLLAQGTPSDGPAGLPSLRERQMNYRIVQGSKYARAADSIASNAAAE
jgi:hypothetical protein